MATTATKKDVIDKLTQRTGLPRQQVTKVFMEFFEVMIQELRKGHRLEFRDFGVFELKERAARTAQNPKTLAPVTVPARKFVKFKPGRLMRSTGPPAARSVVI